MGGAVTFFVINLGSFEELGGQLLAENQKLEELQKQLDFETKATESNMTSLLRINRDLRKEFDELEEGSKGAEDELSFLLPKIKSLEDQVAKWEETLAEAEQKIKVIEEKIDPEVQRMDTLKQQKDETLLKVDEISVLHTDAENQWRELDQNFSSLVRVREIARETYVTSRDSLLDEIVLPFEVFYGVSVEAEVESVSTKENGFFVKKGLDDGLKAGFVFLLQLNEDWEVMPVFVRCELAEKKYSFLKIISDSNKEIAGEVGVGEKLSLIRSSDLSSSNDSPILDSEKILSQNDL